ncbi:hypothetical protein WCLP8_1890011 [uncultured Gammaproteobacteria bacterium]
MQRRTPAAIKAAVAKAITIDPKIALKHRLAIKDFEIGVTHDCGSLWLILVLNKVV